MKKMWLLVVEATTSFIRNDDAAKAASLSFYSMLSLIPALFLLAHLNTLSEGLARLVQNETRSLLTELMPSYSREILDQLLRVTAPGKTVSIINAIILLWSITPLISSVRKAFDSIFKVPGAQRFFIRQVADIFLVTLFIVAFSAIATAGVVISLMPSGMVPPLFATALPFAAFLLMVFVTFLMFSPSTKMRYVFTGALFTTILWFAIRPLFSLFLTYNKGFGLAFGSLKSIFVIVVWVYLSQWVFLFGIEVAACLRRKETIIIKRLMDGQKVYWSRTMERLMVSAQPGQVLIQEGQCSGEMYYLLNGEVEVLRGQTRISELGPGRFIGEMSFFLDEPHTATVRTIGDCEMVTISHEHFKSLMLEFPDLVEEMIREMAHRLKRVLAHLD